jgi:hypothetical protein
VAEEGAEVPCRTSTDSSSAAEPDITRTQTSSEQKKTETKTKVAAVPSPFTPSRVTRHVTQRAQHFASRESTLHHLKQGEGESEGNAAAELLTDAATHHNRGQRQHEVWDLETDECSKCAARIPVFRR